ncbi:MAG: glycosyltransferase family 39 protein [Acetobacteraceae bacterium]|nr:glycosyltransferase family 39 protein [Acetobacteraceae bacterium]
MFVVILLVRLYRIGAIAVNADELLHLYAARSLLHDGTLTIFGGVYERATHFTHLVAASIALFGDNPTAIRLPSAVAGAALVALTYLWMRREAGLGPAVVAAALLGLMAPVSDMAQFGRPYAVQSVLFWAATVLFYRSIVAVQSRSVRLISAAASVALLAESAQFQVTSLIGAAGLATWLVLYGTWRLRSSVSLGRLALAWAAGLLLCALFSRSSAFAGLYGSFRSTVFWGIANKNDLFFYIRLIDRRYNFLLDFLPIAIITAIAVRPRPGLFCSVVFVSGFVLQSMGGMKAERYLAYLLPFLACIWGLAAWPLLVSVRNMVAARIGPASSRRWAGSLVTVGVASFCVVVAIRAAPVLSEEVRELALPGYYRPRPDERERLWREHAAILRPLAEKAAIFAVGDDLLADYYVARPDLVLNTSRLLENEPFQQFVRDYRTGIPTIDDRSALHDLLACFDSGLIVDIDFVYEWLSPDAKAFLREHMTPLDLGPVLHGFTWSAREGKPGRDCAGLRQLVSASQRDRRIASERP